MILTGSNARDLKESAERLPGRRGHGRDIAVYPATPAELRTLPCFAHLPDSQLIDLYLRMGGFPHAIRDVANFGGVSDETYQTYKNWIIGDAARYDLSIESLRHMMYRVFVTCGSRVTLNSIIVQTPLKSHETGLRYLEHLEDSFLGLMHYCYDPDLDGPTFRKSRKVYFVDPLLYFLADSWKLGLTNIWNRTGTLMSDRSFVGSILESAVVVLASRGRETYFWYSSKTKKEVDLVVKEAGKMNLFDVKLSHEYLPPQLGKKVTSLDASCLLQDASLSVM